MKTLITNIYEPPTNPTCNDELWKLVYSNHLEQFEAYLKESKYPIIIYDQNGKIYPFNPETFLDQFYVPQALRIMINQQFEGNVEQYLQNVSQLGTKVLFVNLNEGRVNIKYIQN